jgi:ketol-acid reductoisomerase
VTESRIYHDRDADLNYLKDKKIAIIGYGNQGRAQALNLRDSGLEVIVGTLPDISWEQAKADGVTVGGIREAASQGDIIMLLIPDEVMPEVFGQQILPELRDNKVLDFASGYNIAFGLIKPPPFVDVILLAPRMIGVGVRDLYLKGEGFPSFIAVEQDYSGQARDILLALAKGIGSTKAGVIEVTFAQEAEMDLFTEQAVGAIMSAAIQTAIEIEIEAGYPPEAVLLELYMSGEMGIVFNQIVEKGFIRQMDLHSRTSQYGTMTRRPLFATAELKAKMKDILEKIRSGEFAREWMAEQKAGHPVFNDLKQKALSHPLNALEDKVRRELKGK